LIEDEATRRDCILYSFFDCNQCQDEDEEMESTVPLFFLQTKLIISFVFPYQTCFLQANKIGILNRTKLADGGGRRLRKNWSSGLIAMSEDFLILFKETKVSRTVS